ncbi:MAG: Acylphosphatase, partial [Candidatus Brocadiaceae bacterium]|nr:Acylphosphatase [Candidatus Brocadiaceae bacterium]
MMENIETVNKFCIIDAKEEALLLSTQRPIVLLKKKSNCNVPHDVFVHPPPLTPPTRGGGKTFPPPRWGRPGGGAGLLLSQLLTKTTKPWKDSKVLQTIFSYMTGISL